MIAIAAMENNDYQSLPSYDYEHGYQPVLLVQVQAVDQTSAAVVTVKLDSGALAQIASYDRLNKFTVGDYAILKWHTYGDKSERYVIETYRSSARPLTTQELAEYDARAKKQYEEAINARNEEKQFEIEFLQRYRELFGEGRVRRAVVEGIFIKSDYTISVKCRDEDTGKSVTAYLHKWHQNADYKPGDHVILSDESYDTKPLWTVNRIPTNLGGSTQTASAEAYAEAAEDQLQRDMKLHQGMEYKTPVFRRNSRYRYTKRTLDELAAAYGKVSVGSVFDPKVLCKKCCYYDSVKKNIYYLYERYDVIKITRKTVVLDGGYEIRYRGGRSSLRNSADIVLDRITLERTGEAHGAGDSGVFVLEMPESERKAQEQYQARDSQGVMKGRAEHLAVLGLIDPASNGLIKITYRRLARQWHPDQNHNSKESNSKFLELQAAYEFLIPPGTKVSYEEEESAAEAAYTSAEDTVDNDVDESSVARRALDGDVDGDAIVSVTVTMPASVLTKLEQMRGADALSWSELFQRLLDS